MAAVKCLCYTIFFKKMTISKNISLYRYLFGKTIKIAYKKSILKECIRSYLLHGSMFCLGIYMSVSKPSICFWKQVISIKWSNKLLIHNINLTGHRKSACFLQLLVFLEIQVIALFWHWRTQVFPKGCCHHDLKALCETGYKSVFSNITENMK